MLTLLSVAPFNGFHLFPALNSSLDSSNCCWCCASSTDDESELDKMMDKIITINRVPIRSLDAYYEINVVPLSNDEHIKICELCTIQLENFLNFRRKCQASNRKTISNSMQIAPTPTIIEIDLSDDEVTEIEISDDNSLDSNPTNTCDICSDSFSSLSLLKVHTEMHAKAFSLLEHEVEEPTAKILTELKLKQGKVKKKSLNFWLE
jgi:hypothetical protein